VFLSPVFSTRSADPFDDVKRHMTDAVSGEGVGFLVGLPVAVYISRRNRIARSRKDADDRFPERRRSS
jgi:hypothetical protein